MTTNNKGRLQVYGNVVNDELELNQDGTLDLILAVSTGEKDRAGEIIDPSAFDMIAEQLPKHNLHLNHGYTHEETIGSIPSAMVDPENNRILITTKILPEPAKDIKMRNDIGMHFGGSIGADYYFDPNQPNKIYKADVADVSITHFPMNQGTMDTIMQKDQFADTCITGSCKKFLDYINDIGIKSMKNQNQNNNNTEPAEPAGFDVDKLTKSIGELVDIRIDEKLKGFSDDFTGKLGETFSNSLDKILDTKFNEFKTQFNNLEGNEPQGMGTNTEPANNTANTQEPVNINQSQANAEPAAATGDDGTPVFGQKSMSGLQNLKQEEIINGVYNMFKKDLMNHNTQPESLLKKFEQKSMQPQTPKKPSYRDEFGRNIEYL